MTTTMMMNHTHASWWIIP